MNFAYPFHEAYFAAKYRIDKTKPDSPLVGFAGTKFNANFRLISKALSDEGIAWHYNYYRSIKHIPIFKKTTLWISSHGPFFIPDYQIYRLTGKRTAKWLDIWHGVGSELPNGRAKMISDYDKALVSSQFYKHVYESSNPAIRGRCVVTGFPRCDLLDANSRPENIVLYAPSYQNPTITARTKDPGMPARLREVATKHGYDFIFSPHPNEGINLNTDLNKVAILITDYSSIASDFALLKRPMIFIDRGFNPGEFVIPIQNRGGIVTDECTAPEELASVINSAWHHDQQYLDTIFAYQYRQNTERVVKLIKGMA